jgi:hypothetical protein
MLGLTCSSDGDKKYKDNFEIWTETTWKKKGDEEGGW